MIFVDVDISAVTSNNYPVKTIMWDEVPAKFVLDKISSSKGRLNGQYRALREEVRQNPYHSLAGVVEAFEGISLLSVETHDARALYKRLAGFAEAVRTADWSSFTEQEDPKLTQERRNLHLRIDYNAAIVERQLPNIRRVITRPPTTQNARGRPDLEKRTLSWDSTPTKENNNGITGFELNEFLVGIEVPGENFYEGIPEMNQLDHPTLTVETTPSYQQELH